MIRNKQLGFTLIEVSIVVAITAVIAGFSFQTYKLSQSKTETNLAATTVATSMRRAMAQARAVSGDTMWGVKIQNSQIVVFKGTSYASRDTASDEVYSVPSWLTFSGINEVVFNKLTGMPVSTGTVNITGPNNSSSTITLNSYGSIDY